MSGDVLVEVRPGRNLWLKSRSASPASDVVVLFIHGACANLEQVRSDSHEAVMHSISTLKVLEALCRTSTDGK